MELTISINEQTLARLLEMASQAFCLEKVIPQNQTQQKQLDTMLETQTLLWRHVQTLQKQVARLHSKPPGSPAQGSQASETPTSQSAVLEAKAASRADKAPQGKAPDEAKAERWVRENLEEWLDTPCQFAKAQGRTWRELGENHGERIAVNGRAASPRAYLHALEGWKNGNVWGRIKAKVALELGKQASENHLAAIMA